jgi:dihydrofolate reductase
MATSLCEELCRADTIILGRVTYQVMANYWQTHSECLDYAREDIVFAEMINRYKKIVFSKTIHRLSWNNSTLVAGDMNDEISRLKQLPGKDMIIYGSGKLVNSLMHSRLVDEFVLWVHPVLLGKGKPFFTEVNGQVDMELIDRKTFCSGVVALRYRVKRQETNKSQITNSKTQINHKL